MLEQDLGESQVRDWLAVDGAFSSRQFDRVFLVFDRKKLEVRASVPGAVPEDPDPRETVGAAVELRLVRADIGARGGDALT